MTTTNTPLVPEDEIGSIDHSLVAADHCVPADKNLSDDFRSFFTAAEAWGNISQKRVGGKQVNTIEPKQGSLEIKTVIFDAYANSAEQVQLTVNGQQVVTTNKLVDDKLIVSMDALLLQAGDLLTVNQ
ncbi:MAG: hypothetical protein P8M62_06830 [Opitutae bacterium]|nr:hypothetical protein [Opitutae bacterium]